MGKVTVAANSVQQLAQFVFAMLSRLVPQSMRISLIAMLFNSKAIGFFVDVLYKLFAKDAMQDTQAFFRENMSRAEAAAALLEDEKSKEVYRSLIQYRCSRKRRDINPYQDKNLSAYLDKELIAPSPSEVFADCGAYGGESSLLFQKYCLSAGQPAPQCILIEPDPLNQRCLNKNIPKFAKEPIVFPIGLWSRGDNLNFFSNSVDSRIDSAGSHNVAVDTLDNLLGNIPELPPITYIKIDVEGADLDVLHGAHRTIQKYRPRIAIAIYHTDEHMLKIPETIHALYPEYRLFIRHYSSTHPETMLYCLP